MPTFTTGQIFTGSSTLSAGQTGQAAFLQTGSVDFTTGTKPAIQDVVISKDILASSTSYSGATIQSFTVNNVNPGQVITLTTNDLPPGVTLPPGFTLPQNVVSTNLGVTASTNFGPVTGTLAVIGSVGSLELVGHASFVVFGQTVNVGAGVFSFGTQTTGSGLNEVFAPAFTVACFAAGTRIGTVHGDVAVEYLREGDDVVRALGGAAPVRWIGQRRIDCTRHPRPADVWPVRVQAGAFAPGAPKRDLLLSPDHAVHADGRLIPIRYLVNGASIVQTPVDQVTYFHVELDRHDVLLAEGLACESYLDTGNRAAFENAAGATMLHADFARAVWDARGCAPLLTEGPALEAVQVLLLSRAATLGHRRGMEPAVVLEADGAEITPVLDEGRYRFALPAGLGVIRLRSRCFVPGQMFAGNADHRSLGVAIQGLQLDGQDVSLDDIRMGAGWMPPESGWRWTDGAAEIATGGAREVSFVLAMVGDYWISEAAVNVRAA